MSDKPSYLGLLNAISVAESDAEQYLTCWAQTTAHEGVRRVISTVALREGEHGKAFAKRICELGYALQPREDPKLAAKLAVAGDPSLSDCEKFERLGVGAEVDDGRDDIFAGMFRDQTIDIQTGALLGRYIAEERDSGRMLRACYEQVRCEAHEAAADGRAAAAAGAAGVHVEERLARIEATLAEVCARLERC